MKKRLLMPMQLQFFAEQDGATEETTSTETTETTTEETKKEETGKTFSRDEVAKMLAAENSKAMAAAEEKWRAEKDEAAKLAKMDEKEKADYEKQQLEAKIADYERKEVLSKMSDKASEMLTEKGANPTKELLALIVSEDAETTSNNVKAYLSAIELERQAIKADYEKRLGGKIPLDGNGASPVVGQYGKYLAQRTHTESPKQTYFKN